MHEREGHFCQLSPSMRCCSQRKKILRNKEPCECPDLGQTQAGGLRSASECVIEREAAGTVMVLLMVLFSGAEGPGERDRGWWQ